MCLYLALTGSLLRGIFRRLFNDLVDWVVFGRRAFCPTNINLEKNYEDKPWFHRVDRRRGQQLVEEGGNGCYLVRPSTKHMMTLSLWYNGRAYNIPIRKRDDGQYSLGTLKPNERVFTTLDDIIEHFTAREDLILFSRGVRTGHCRLRSPPPHTGNETYKTVQEVDDGYYINLSVPTEHCVLHV